MKLESTVGLREFRAIRGAKGEALFVSAVILRDEHVEYRLPRLDNVAASPATRSLDYLFAGELDRTHLLRLVEVVQSDHNNSRVAIYARPDGIEFKRGFVVGKERYTREENRN